MVSGLRRWAVAIGCVPLLLTGCPQLKKSASSGVAAQATAPAIAAPPPSAAPAPAITQAQAIDIATKAYKVQQLIQQVERAYQSGVDNYRGERLEAARSDFDLAVDMMLTSGMDVKNDAQLSEEFERLLNAINALEMSALKQGNGFSAPLEAAPLDAANEVTFPPDAALTAKVTEELKTTQSDFPLVVNDYVAGFISYFTNSPTGHAHLLRSLERAGKYKEMISQGPERGGRAAGPDLSCGDGVGLPAAGPECAFGRRRHVAVHALRWIVWAHAQWLARRAVRPGEIIDCLCEVYEVAL